MAYTKEDKLYSRLYQIREKIAQLSDSGFGTGAEANKDEIERLQAEETKVLEELEEMGA